MESTDWKNLKYNVGLGNHFESEAEAGALPIGQNAPQKCSLGLYAEQLSGTPFTFGKHKNRRSWLYKILPTVKHGNWKDISHDFKHWISDFDSQEMHVSPEQFRWKPPTIED